MHLRRLARILSGTLAVLLLLLLPAQALSVQEARELLEEYYIDPVPQDVLDQGTVQAMLDKLGDPYTQYFTPEQYAEFLASMEDTDIVGIGVVSLQGSGGLTITSVLPGSPAEGAGLQAGDVITAVDGRSAAGVDSSLVSSWIQGEEGTSVQVTYLRDGDRRTITLERDAITIPSTSFQMLDGHIGYLECTTFGPDTLGHFQDAVSGYDSAADHWIVDLRGNGGGLTQAAVQSVGFFAGKGTMGYLRSGGGSCSAFGQDEEALSINPVIVLSDGYTASSSELFSACVRDLDAGIVIGGRTFGKGVAQTLLDQETLPDYFPDGDAIKITSFRYFAPGGATTNTVGIIPHLLVPSDLARQVAELLSATAPGGDTSGYYRLDLVWRWYIDKDTVRQPEYREAFEALLSAIPSTARLWTGTGGPTGWRSTDAASVAAENGVSWLDRSFTDTEDSPYAQAIDLLGTYGVLSGTGDGRFDPEGSLTRAQLCALLAQALNCNVPDGPSAFTDVSMDAWYGPAVNALAGMGLVSGLGDGRFAPDAPVTHEQYISIMGRLARYLSLNFHEAYAQMPDGASDTEALAPWASWARWDTWLLALSQRGYLGNTLSLLWDDLDGIAPQSATTREEAAALLYQVLSYTGVFPI